MMSLRDLARALGGDVVGHQVLAPGPGHSPADRSMAVTPSHQSPFGFITYSHAGDHWSVCRDHVLRLLGLPREVGRRALAPALEPAEKAAANIRSSGSERETFPLVEQGRVRDKIGQFAGVSGRALETLWRETEALPGTLAERYLAGRGLHVVDDLHHCARFHPRCPWREGDGKLAFLPALITAYRTIVGDELAAVQRTALAPDGAKIGRRMLGPTAGAAIKIDSEEDVTYGLHIAEGFESALAGRTLGFRPCWALGSAGAVGNFPVLAGIDALTILAETDDTGANARAIAQCGDRWIAAGREVLTATPLIGGDMNDVVRP